MSGTDTAPAASRPPRGRTGHRAREFLDHIVRNEQTTKKRDRSMPPLPMFDFEALADGTHLNQVETAAVLRRSVSCLENWRKDPEHPLKWQRVAGRVIYTARAIRKYRKTVTKTK
jgi:hypothetical protein